MLSATIALAGLAGLLASVIIAGLGLPGAGRAASPLVVLAFAGVSGVALVAGGGLWAVLSRTRRQRSTSSVSQTHEVVEELGVLLARLDSLLQLPRDKWFLGDSVRESFEPHTRSEDASRYRDTVRSAPTPARVRLLDNDRRHGSAPTWLAEDVHEQVRYTLALLGPIRRRCAQLELNLVPVVADLLFFIPLVLGNRVEADGTYRALGRDQLAQIRIYWTVMSERAASAQASDRAPHQRSPVDLPLDQRQPDRQVPGLRTWQLHPVELAGHTPQTVDSDAHTLRTT